MILNGIDLKVSPGGGSELFQPSGSPAGWWDATKITGLEDGDPVGTWSDLSGNGKDLSQASAGNKPTYKTDIQNGLPAVLGDGSDDYINKDWTSVDQPNTHFVAGQFLTLKNSLMADSYSTKYQSLGEWDLGGGALFYIHGGTALRGPAGGADTDPHVFSALYNGASSVLREDGAQIAAGNANTQQRRGFQLFADFGESAPAHCYVFEAVIYDSSEDAAANESALMAKWGIS